MTDDPEDGRRAPDLGLPTAGRKPASLADAPAAPPDSAPAAPPDTAPAATHDAAPTAAHDAAPAAAHGAAPAAWRDAAPTAAPANSGDIVPAASGEIAASPDDEPTVVTPPPARLDDDRTTSLTPAPAEPAVPAVPTAPVGSLVAVDDEPTVQGLTRPPRPDVGGGDTVRLTPPAVVPGPGTPPEPAMSPEPVTGPESSEVSARQPLPPWRRWSSAGALIWVLLALFGFTLVTQLRSNSADQGLATARQEDLVRILSELEARDQRLQTEIGQLEQSQRQLTSGVEGRQAALADAQKRADELGLLAGTIAGKGPGLKIVINPGAQVKASAILNAVQELRGAGGEVMQINGANGTAVRIVAPTFFVDADSGAITVDGKRLTGPYTIWVIGVPQTMQTALQIPGGVVASVNGAGGTVTMEARDLVEVSALHEATSLRYARPVS